MDEGGTRNPGAIRLANISDGDVVGLYGFGASAHIVIQVLRHSYLASPVFVFTRSSTHRDLAAQLIDWIITYQNCRQHIKENFVTLNSLGLIADSCNIDHAYLCRLFKRFDTQSPYQYLTHFKMAFAARRLAEPGILVKEIAYTLGFGDPFHFSRVFKKVFSISPQSLKRLR